MGNLVKVRINQFLETWRSEGAHSVARKVLFLNREIIPAERDLSTLPVLKRSLKAEEIRFIAVEHNFIEQNELKYGSKNRHLRVLKNIKKGYKGFAVEKGGEIVGDVWYSTRIHRDMGNEHPDLKWLAWVGIKLEEHDVYLFEMYVKPQERGGGLVNFLLLSSLNALKEKGYKRAYGYCTADNIPALWVHRTLRYKEYDRIRMHRILTATYRSIRGDNPNRLFRFFDLS